MEITWFGTANLKLKSNNTSIHFDPFISMNNKNRDCSEFSSDVAENIFITHGHFDHLMDVPELIREGDYHVNCSGTAAGCLLNQFVDLDKINVIHEYQQIRVGSMEIQVLPGRHSKAGLKLFLKTFINPHVLFQISSVCGLLKTHRRFPCGPVFAYHISCAGKHILHLGSMDIDPGTEYPRDVDLLMLPYQGCSNLENQASKIIQKIFPRSILLHHFDDSFPPISKNVDTGKFIRYMKKKFPHIPVYVPEYRRVISF